MIQNPIRNDDYLLELLHQTFCQDMANGLQMWSTIFDQYREAWDFTGCHRLLREVKITPFWNEVESVALILVRAAEGVLYAQLGQWENAVACYKHAIRTSPQEDLGTRAMLLSNLGNIHFLSRQPQAALPFYLEALTLYQELGSMQAVGSIVTLTNLGGIYRDLGQLEEAIVCYQGVLASHSQLLQRPDIKAIALANLGAVWQLQQQWKKAETVYLEAIELFTQLQDQSNCSQVLGNLGTLYLDTEQFSVAIPYFLQDLEMAQQLNDPVSQSQTLNNLAIAYRHLGYTDDALYCYQHSLMLKREMADSQGELKTLMYLYELLQAKGDWQEAQVYLQELQSLVERKQLDESGASS